MATVCRLNSSCNEPNGVDKLLVKVPFEKVSVPCTSSRALMIVVKELPDALEAPTRESPAIESTKDARPCDRGLDICAQDAATSRLGSKKRTCE